MEKIRVCATSTHQSGVAHYFVCYQSGGIINELWGKNRCIQFIVGCSWLLLVVAGCGSSSSSQTVNLPPQNVQMVSGDGHSSEVQNTISWTLDPNATVYTVYWDNVPGVSESSAVLVPTIQGTRHAIHSGVDVTAGATFYYRVQSTTDEGVSPLSAEATGTPKQSITNNQLNDVAWNGADTLIAVDNSGVILNSPNGIADAWVDASTVNTPRITRTCAAMISSCWVIF